MLEYILFIFGFFFLLAGARYLIEGSSSFAKRMGLPPLIVGLTILAFGTSMPELVVTLVSAFRGSTELALGNIVGSNIANILLVLGIGALIYPITVKSSTIWKEIPFGFLAAIVLFVVANDRLIDNGGITYSALTRIDGIVMLLFFVIFLVYIYELARKHHKKAFKEEVGMKYNNWSIIALMMVSGMLGLYFGGKWIVDGALAITSALGWSEFLVASTIIAVGTSLPELVTTIIAALNKEVDLAVGNLVGSNLFNIFYVLALSAVISPIKLPPLINIDIIFLIFVSLLLFVYLFIGEKRKLHKWQGLAFLILYVMYVVSVIIRG
ncbi:MAG: calcium/sodium antiporter [archaeon]